MLNVFSFTHQVANDSNMQIMGTIVNVQKKAFPTDNKDIVRWAAEKFGGVTSFTTIQNPMSIASTGREGETDTYNVPQTYTILKSFFCFVC